jgi:hypothetical protein
VKQARCANPSDASIKDAYEAVRKNYRGLLEQLDEVMRNRGGLEEVDEGLAHLLQHAHAVEAQEHHVLDQQAALLEEAEWNWDMHDEPDLAAMEGEAEGHEAEEPHDLPGPMQNQEQPVAAEEPEQQGIDGDDGPAHPRPAAEPGQARWFAENANELPFQGARFTVMQIILAALTIVEDKSVHQATFNLFMKLVSEVLPEGNNWPRCYLLTVANEPLNSTADSTHISTARFPPIPFLVCQLKPRSCFRYGCFLQELPRVRERLRNRHTEEI